MSTATALAVVAVAALGTYAARGALILVLAGRELPAAVERALAHVGPAVLAALTINLAIGGRGIATVEVAEVAALVVAAAVAVWRANLVWTFVAGMATLWIVSSLG
ncbi:AzlD domain-containing protein [Ilumatobacter sp.]|uniref:AzlD domain-containing protein n=1 Tax=Ilumatobacter sp. TaxID=1967498 RepID=UPI003B52F474